MVMWVRNTEREKRELRKVKKSIGGVERMRVGFKCKKNSSNYAKKKQLQTHLSLFTIHSFLSSYKCNIRVHFSLFFERQTYVVSKTR